MPSEKAQVSEEMREFVREELRNIAEILKRNSNMSISEIHDFLKEILSVSI